VLIVTDYKVLVLTSKGLIGGDAGLNGGAGIGRNAG
jgi:hypothetical protein